MDVGAVGKGTSSTGGKGKVVANVTIRRSKNVRDVVTRITLQQTVLTLTNRAENVERLVIWRVHVDLLDRRSPIRRVAARRARECKFDQNVLDLWRDRTPLIPVPQEECRPSGKVGHSKPSGLPGNHHDWCDWKLLRPWQRE